MAKKSATDTKKETVALKMIPTSSVRENAHALRSAKKEEVEYECLRDSIAQYGILKPILVKEIKDPDTGETIYGLIDGLQRWNCALDLGLKEIPVHVKDFTQAEIEEAQIVANLHKIETKPIEYTNQLQRILERTPTMTKAELAAKINSTEKWIDERLGLLKLPEKVQSLVNEGKIKLRNGVALGNLAKVAKDSSEEEVEKFIDRAMTQDVNQFVPAVANRIKEINDARREGRRVSEEKFEPIPHQRPWGQVKEELLNGGKTGDSLITKYNVKNPKDAWNLAIAWVSNLDPESKQAQIDEHERRKAEKEEQKQKRKEEREQKKREEAARIQAEIESESEEFVMAK